MSSIPDRDTRAALPADGGPDFNRLVHERSPYLLQHAANPVDWYPWGAEALERAKALDRPIFLSVGYSTCHWCHVMERESFEDEGIAALLDSAFVPVKVDREERPDLDDHYMKVTQLMTGRGGWPNSVWLTPDGRPWYAGTYFPPDDRSGQPGFRSLLMQLAEVWKTRRDDIEQQANDLAERATQLTSGRGFEGESSPELLRRAFVELEGQFDRTHGGFGGAPKFPPHGSLALLLAELSANPGQPALQNVAFETLDAMAAGGIHDQVGGGFHRYSTDAEWLLPHFEKMLYDNASLSRSYVDAWAISGHRRFRRVAERTYDWVLREMTDESAAFHSAQDADSEGEEGKFYVWTQGEVLSLLGPGEGRFFCDIARLKEEGNYLDESTRRATGTNIPHLAEPLELFAERTNQDIDGLVERFDGLAARLYQHRERRVHPHLDDKVLTAWNGMMIASLAYGGAVLERPDYVDAAVRAAKAIRQHSVDGDRLLRSYRDGSAHVDGFLDDYAHWIDALLELHRALGEEPAAESALVEAETWADRMIARFADEEAGGFYFSTADHPDTIGRGRDPFDSATPSGNGTAARVLAELAALTGESKYAEYAQRTISAFAGAMDRHPRGTESLLLAFHRTQDRQGGSRSPIEGAFEEGWDVARRIGPVDVRVRLSTLVVRPQGSVQLELAFVPEPGVMVVGDEGAASGSWPDGEPPRVTLRIEGEETAAVRAEPLWYTASFSAPGTEGSSHVAIDVEFSACHTDRCLPRESLTLSLPILVSSEAESRPRW